MVFLAPLQWLRERGGACSLPKVGGGSNVLVCSDSALRACNSRVFEGVNDNRPCPDTVSTFEIHCLAGEFTFGDPFQDSGVVVALFGNRARLITTLPSEEGTTYKPRPESGLDCLVRAMFVLK